MQLKNSRNRISKLEFYKNLIKNCVGDRKRIFKCRLSDRKFVIIKIKKRVKFIKIKRIII